MQLLLLEQNGKENILVQQLKETVSESKDTIITLCSKLESEMASLAPQEKNEL